MNRGVSPVVGVVVLVFVTAVLAVSVGAVVSTTGSEPVPTASFSVAADGDARQIAISHEGGDVVDVSDIDLRVAIDGEQLTHQPPVPFFQSDGFRGGPTGPFNNETAGDWHAGETASLRLAETNTPHMSAGSTVTVVITAADTVVFEETVRAR